MRVLMLAVSLFAVSSVYAAETPIFKITEKLPTGRVNTAELYSASLKVNQRSAKLGKKEVASFKSQVLSDAELGSAASETFCRPGQRTELTVDGKKRVFCKNLAVMKKLSEVFSSMKVVAN